MTEVDGDGLLLNLNIGDDIVNYKPTYKGGRWRDRVKAVKIARNKHERFALAKRRPTQENNADEPQQTRVQDDDQGADQEGPRRVKKRRLEENAKPAAPEGGGKAAMAGASGHNHAPAQASKAKPRDFISSLFSSNPASKTAKEATAPDQAPAEPSNAPLADGTSTFTTLGLSTTVSSHLLNKLNLKAPTSVQKVAIPQLIKDDSDAFIQAQTGSGKTLAYLLPILQRIMQSSGELGKGPSTHEDVKIHRHSGLFAIILAPTRELCRQISTVLETLRRCAPWIVAGTVIGGEKKKSEKARLRKGLNILVATPGRLADHLDNTEVLDVSQVRWLVLDEGDRLMELGFEEEIKRIVSRLQERQVVARAAEAAAGARRAANLPRRRITILCSATMKMTVQRLGEISLQNAVHLKAEPENDHAHDGSPAEVNFSAPAQLNQSFAVVSAKLRLVTLVAVLRRAFVRRGSVMKAIVFITCADSVDYHFEVFARPPSSENILAENDDQQQQQQQQTKPSTTSKKDLVDELGKHTIATASALSSKSNMVTIYKLHGSLPQHVRTSTLNAFSRSKDPSVMVCTDVASRGLDLPNVDLVIEYDPAFSRDDHLHRVGRTARAGRAGRTMIFLLPGSEEGYVEILKQARHDTGRALVQHDADDLLRKGFGSPGIGAGNDWERQATDWQLEVERWVLAQPGRLDMARRAYQSHVRAYATHVASERHLFDIKTLHLGHLAKSFALRDRPGSINVPGLRAGKDGGRSGSTKARAMQQQQQQYPKRAGHTAEKRNAATAAAANDSSAMTTMTMDEVEAGRKKMQKKLKEHMAGISEFNIG